MGHVVARREINAKKTLGNPSGPGHLHWTSNELVAPVVDPRCWQLVMYRPRCFFSSVVFQPYGMWWQDVKLMAPPPAPNKAFCVYLVVTVLLVLSFSSFLINFHFLDQSIYS
jgi:hypothetical protein